MGNKNSIISKTIITYFAAAMLLVIALIYFFSNSKGTLNRKDSSFAMESIEEITEIKISSTESNVALMKEVGFWKVNNKYKVKHKNIENLLAAINRIDLLSPVSKIEKQQITSIIESDGILVEIYKKNRIIKKYYISKPGMHKSKTYMMMEKSSNPYIVQIPGYKGFIADWFVSNESYWRDKTLFNYQPQNIKNISFNYPNNPNKSFRVINYNNGTFALQSLNDDKFIEEFNVDRVARFFTYFQGITFNDVVTDLTKQQVDSITQSVPQVILSVDDIYGIKNTLKIYRKPAEQEFDEFGQKALFDYNYTYAVLNESDELILIQYYTFDPLLKEIDYFR